MMNALKSMGQSVQSLGNKALTHPNWAGKTGFAVLTLMLLAVCAVALVIVPLMFLVVGMAKNALNGKAITDAEWTESIERQNDAADDDEWRRVKYD